MALTQSGSLPDKLDAPDEGHVEPERLAGHGKRDFDAARADRQHADRTGCRSMTVGAEQSFSGFAETFLMDRMADTVAGTAEPDSETPAGGLKEEMIVRILVVFLNEVVIDVLGGEFGFDPVDAHRLQFKHDHGAGGILRQGLVDVDADLRARRHRAGYEMRLNEFPCDIEIHGRAPFEAGLAELQCNRVTGQQSMEECLADLTVGILIVPRRVVERAQQFFAVKIARSRLYELVHKRAHGIVVGNGEFVRMLASHRIAPPFIKGTSEGIRPATR